MVGNIIVAVAVNLVAVAILLSGIFSAKSNGIKVTLVKFFMTLAGAVGAYFLAPFLSDKLLEASNGAVAKVATEIGISGGTINSCLFMLIFVLFYATTLVICSFVRHARIKKLQNKRLNKVKMRRARSINPHAERAIQRAEWKALKAKYREKRRWYHTVISSFIGAIVAVFVGLVVIMPYGFIAKDINHEGDKQYLEKGYEYTLNGLIPESAFDWAVNSDKAEAKLDELTKEDATEAEDDATEVIPEETTGDSF